MSTTLAPIQPIIHTQFSVKLLLVPLLGALGSIGWALSVLWQSEPQLPVSLVPTINLSAIILGAVSMGMLLNRVRQLERRMDKVQRRVFHEDTE